MSNPHLCKSENNALYSVIMAAVTSATAVFIYEVTVVQNTFNIIVWMTLTLEVMCFRVSGYSFVIRSSRLTYTDLTSWPLQSLKPLESLEELAWALPALATGSRSKAFQPGSETKSDSGLKWYWNKYQSQVNKHSYYMFHSYNKSWARIN